MPFPLPTLIRPQGLRRPDPLYDIRLLDRSGRINARRLLDALAWHRRQQLNARLGEGVIALTSPEGDDNGEAYVDGQGHLRLRASPREQARVDDGHLLLLAGTPSATLLVFPPAARTAMLAPWTGPLVEAFPA